MIVRIGLVRAVVYRHLGLLWLSLRAAEEIGQREIGIPQTVPPEFRGHKEGSKPSDTRSDGVLVDKTWIVGPCLGRLHNAIAMDLTALGVEELPVNMPRRTMFPKADA